MPLLTRGRRRLVLGVAAAAAVVGVVVVVVVDFRDGVRCLQMHIAVCREGVGLFLGESTTCGDRWLLCGDRALDYVREPEEVLLLCDTGALVRRTRDATMVADVLMQAGHAAESADWMRCKFLTQLAS